MTTATRCPWEAKRSDETRMVEDTLTKAGFETVDAYRYNSASIRVRVIDKRFEGLSNEDRDAMVEPHLAKLPEETQADIISLFTFSPSELEQEPRLFKGFLQNREFEDPSPSML
jgi:hypothetical protein